MMTQQEQVNAVIARIHADLAAAAQRSQRAQALTRQQFLPSPPAQPAQQRATRPTVAQITRACHELAPVSRALSPDEQVALAAALISAQRHAQGA